MKVNQLVTSVRKEVEKPFEEKIQRTFDLISLWANHNCYLSCSFGKDSMVLLNLTLETNPKIPVVFMNTGIEFSETLQFRNQILSQKPLNFYETKPIKSFFEVCKHSKGHMDDGRKHSNQCCRNLKEVPAKRLAKSQGWTATFTGITAMESRNRMFTACQKGMEYYNKEKEITMIHPLMFWTPEEVLRYSAEHDFCLNPAYAKYGLKRIGCMYCMSHRGWRKEVQKLNPRVYRWLCKTRGDPTLHEWM
jgi:phosphoadenosine phosphosulfate reductase